MALTLVRREGNLLATGTCGRHTAKGGGTAHRASGLSKVGLRWVCTDKYLWAQLGQFRVEAVTVLGPVVSLVTTDGVNGKLSVRVLASPPVSPLPSVGLLVSEEAVLPQQMGKTPTWLESRAPTYPVNCSGYPPAYSHIEPLRKSS